MDTSNSLDISIKMMQESIFPDERELAGKTEQALKELINKLKPILSYVCKPINSSFRGIEIGKNPIKTLEKRSLFLTENGNFMTKVEGERLLGEDDFRDLNTQNYLGRWTEYPFEYLLDRLQAILVGAEEKKEKHLASIAERRAKLDKIIEILKS